MTAFPVDLDLVPVQGADPLPEPTPRPGVVERMTQILDVFDSGGRYYRLEDVSASTGLPRSTAFRFLAQLVALQWLEHSDRGYRLGGRVLGLSARGAGHGDLRIAAADVLTELHLNTGAVAHLGVLEGASITYLDKVGGRAGTSFPSRVGGQLPAHGTALGRSLLSCLTPERVDSALLNDGAMSDPRLDLAALHVQLQSIRARNGVSIYLPRKGGPTIMSVAAPILGPTGAVGAIALAGREALRLEPIVPMVVAAARRTSQLLFPDSAPTRVGYLTRRWGA